MSIHHTITGVVLAGGGGRRMFPQSATGGDKAFVPLRGKPIIVHAVHALRCEVADIVVNANGAADRFAFLDLPVVADAMPDQGPLAGLLAAIDWVLSRPTPASAIVSVSTDTPFLPLDLVTRLRTAAASNQPAIASSQGRIHPVIGLWPVTLRDALAESLREGRRSAEMFAKRHDAIEVPFALRTIGSRTVDPFFNANTPQELAYAEDVLSG